MRDDESGREGVELKVVEFVDPDETREHGEGGFESEFQSLAEVAVKPLEWIWSGLIPRGKLTLITGEPGVGKSLFAIQVTAMVTRGTQTPVLASSTCDTELEKRSEPGAVLLISADDDARDTLRPRLEAAGADVARVLVQNAGRPGNARAAAQSDRQRPGSANFRIARDLEQLEVTVTGFREGGIDVRLIVLDPIDCFMGSAAKDKDLSAMVARLVDLAARSGAAVLAVANSTSSRIGRTGYRVDTIGNPELANAARSVIMIVQDLEHDDQRLVLPVKLNLSANRAGMRFSFRNGLVEWDSKPVPLTGDQYFTQAREKLRNPLAREEHSEIQRVTNWLKERLSPGAASSVSVRADAYENEIAYSTLRRAFHRLGCKATRVGHRGTWYWRLPGQALISMADAANSLDAQESLDAHDEHVRTAHEK